MPDQSSAATEHSIIQEITGPLGTLPDDPVAIVNADFPIALRGYDRLAVDAYVQQTSQLVAELQATRSPETAVRRALERVGEEVSGILQRAHDTAAQITSQSRAEAEDRLEQARGEAANITANAEQRVKDLDADADRIWAERDRMVDDTRALAHGLLALADSATERFPPAEEPEAPVAPYDAQAPEDAPAAYDPQAPEDASAAYDPLAPASAARPEDSSPPPPGHFVPIDEEGPPDDPATAVIEPPAPRGDRGSTDQ